jgi:hypothetical protein
LRASRPVAARGIEKREGTKVKTQGLLAGGIAATLSLATVPNAAAQERSLDEIKTEVIRRAGHINPLKGSAATMPNRWSMRSPA